MPDPRLGARWRHVARVVRGENAVDAAMVAALQDLAKYTAGMLEASGLDPAHLDNRAAPWRTALETGVIPNIEAVFTASFTATARGAILDPEPYATRHIESVWNRLVGVSDDVFDSMRLSLEEGRRAGEDMTALASRVDGFLSDSDRWAGRARVIARTEVIGANNAGAHSGAHAFAKAMGHAPTEVAQEWLATSDSRTRETHGEADGQVVMGLDTPFNVGGSDLQYPGDPSGDPGEVINCRCASLFHYPGDPDYPTDLTAAAQEAPVTTAPPEAPAPDITPVGAPTHAGWAVQAADTGRILMLQRSLDPTDPPEVQGTWEFPGGGIEDGEDAQAAAQREFTEETGLPVPDGEVTGGWASPNGVYQGFVQTVPVEASAFGELNPDLAAAESVNPDDPQRRNPDVTAWFTVEQIKGLGPALRPEVNDTDWTQFAPTPTEEAPVPDDVTAAAGDPAPVIVDPPTDDMAAGDPAPALPMEPDTLADLGDQFYGVMVVENVQTGDGRVFAPDAIVWDDTLLPIPIGWQVQDAPGHDGTVVVGRFDTITRFGNLIGYTGTWDLEGNGWETRRLVDGNFLRGISVDTDDSMVELVNADGTALDGFDQFMPDPDDDPVMVITRSRVRSASMCRVPAFVEAFVANGVPPQGWAGERPMPVSLTDTTTEPAPEDVTAALVASAVALDLPAAALPDPSDFSDPGLDGPTPLTVTADGRVYGHLATWGVCHIGIAGRCQEAPPSPTNYAYYATGSVLCADGTSMPVGPITMNTGHADGGLGHRATVAHYDDTGTVVADAGMGQDAYGIWFAGRLRAGVTEEQVYALRAAGKISGDWRTIGGALDLVAALVVNVPGFPIPRASLAASAGTPVSLVAAGIVTGAQHDTPTTPLTGDTRAFAREVMAALDRRDRQHATRARLTYANAQRRARRVAAASARLNRGA